MPPLLVPPLIVLGAAGAVLAVRWVVKEARRITRELDELRSPAPQPVDEETLPKLKVDPETGEYRPQ
jgi:hypothetical protein